MKGLGLSSSTLRTMPPRFWWPECDVCNKYTRMDRCPECGRIQCPRCHVRYPCCFESDESDNEGIPNEVPAVANGGPD